VWQHTYHLDTLHRNDKTFSLRVWQSTAHTWDVASEQQTTRTAPEDFEGHSAAPTGQRVIDVTTSAVRGVGLEAGIAKMCTRSRVHPPEDGDAGETHDPAAAGRLRPHQQLGFGGLAAGPLRPRY
jgi:hypothetical protein